VGARVTVLVKLFRWLVGAGATGAAAWILLGIGYVTPRVVAFAAFGLLFLLVGHLVFDRGRAKGRGALLADALLSAALLIASTGGFVGRPFDLRPFLFPELASYGRFDPVARIDRSVWPHRLDSPAGFDLASRGEIALFALAIADREAAGHADDAGAARWLAMARSRALANFEQACATCATGTLLCPRAPINTWAGLSSFARESALGLPEELRAWRDQAHAFHAAYLTERLRLAASPVTSEIFAVDDSEILGDDFPDKTFLVTLDDGPTEKAGTTDQTIAVLRRHGRTALFFLIGSRLTRRLGTTSADEVRQLYAGLCVGGHGMEHRRHSEWPQAPATFPQLKAQLATIAPGSVERLFFRPPFGERSRAIVSALSAAGYRDMLWNIDSRDWRDDVSVDDAAARSLTLMLLWRRGIVLFHDAFPKATIALPILWRDLDGSGVRWLECADLDPTSPNGLVNSKR
jgi:peptidoglycan-N-acetylglucosamine deacetylase